MRTILFLLLSWALSQPCATAQTRVDGPWRVRYRLTRVQRESLREENVYYDLLNCRIPSRYAGSNILEIIKDCLEKDSLDVRDDWGAARPLDTTTVLRTKRIVSNVGWAISPDSINLLLSCENPLIAPRRQAGVHFAAIGAALRLDTKHHLLWLAPIDTIVVLRAYRGQRLLFRHRFKAVPPPVPTIRCSGLDGRIATIERPRPGEEELIFGLIVRASPDEDFAAIMPADAAYRVAKASYVLIRQGKAGAPVAFSGMMTDLYQQRFAGLPGDAIQVTVQLVLRRNFQEKIIETPLKKWDYLLSYPLN